MKVFKLRQKRVNINVKFCKLREKRVKVIVEEVVLNLNEELLLVEDFFGFESDISDDEWRVLRVRINEWQNEVNNVVAGLINEVVSGVNEEEIGRYVVGEFSKVILFEFVSDYDGFDIEVDILRESEEDDIFGKKRKKIVFVSNKYIDFFFRKGVWELDF